MKVALENGPIYVSVDAGSESFFYYKSGVMDDTSCTCWTNHAVVLVGFGQENGQEYFILRNSWGPYWGDEGYMKIAAVEGKGICGVNTNPLIVYME